MPESKEQWPVSPMPPAPDRVPPAPRLPEGMSTPHGVGVSGRPADFVARWAGQLGEVHAGFLRVMEEQQAAFLANQWGLQQRLLASGTAAVGVEMAAHVAGLVDALAPGWRSACRSVSTPDDLGVLAARSDEGGIEYSAEHVAAFYEGRPWECFGEALRLTECHVRTPALDSRALRCLTAVRRSGPDEVQAEAVLSAARYAADPAGCLVEVALQLLAFELVARGRTVDRDGWRLSPGAPDSLSLAPVAGREDGEVGVRCLARLVDQTASSLRADCLLYVDGVPVLRVEGVEMSLEVDYPITTRTDLLEGHTETRPFAVQGDLSGDYASLLAAAWGRPSDAFGARFAAFDGERRCPRLPGPPYHFMSRVTRMDAEFGRLVVGASIEVEYDVPPDAWYFAENGSATMPLCVLMEQNLQPCGWLATFTGAALAASEDLVFRNLDGAATVFREVEPTVGTLRSRVEVTRYSAVGDVVILAFAVECWAGSDRVARFETSFGYFTSRAMEAQVGVAPDRAFPATDGPSPRPTDWVPAQGKLLRLGRVASCAPEGGAAGLGRIVVERPVTPGDWYFRAHFYEDPVQPGSIGVESLLQSLQRLLVEKGFVPEVGATRFEPILLGGEFDWKYRGQVTPRHRRATTEVEILELGKDERGVYAVAEGYLWADELAIYHLPRFGVRLVRRAPGASPGEDGLVERVFDPSVETWVEDHRPSYTIPVIPLTCMVDLMAQEACRRFPSRKLVEIADVELRGWIACLEPRRLALKCAVAAAESIDREAQCEVTLLAWRVADPIELSRFEEVCSARFRMAEVWPESPVFSPAPEGTGRSWNPYIEQEIFHGPAFQVVRSVTEYRGASLARLDPSLCRVPAGVIQPGVLDGSLHTIPYRDLSRWSDACPPGYLLLPIGAERVQFYGPMPEHADLDVWAQLVEVDMERRNVRFRVDIAAGGRAWVCMSLVGRLFPTGPFRGATGRDWRAFFGDRRHVPGLSLSSREGDVTRLDELLVRELDWLPGTLERVYQGPADRVALAEAIAVKEHVAAGLDIHPAAVAWDGEDGLARCSHHPLRRWPVRVRRDRRVVAVEADGEPFDDFAGLVAARRERFGESPWPGEDFYFALCQRFVSDLRIEDPEDFAALRGRGAIFLANHQVAVESLLFSTLLSTLTGASIQTIAKASHRDTWIGRLVELCLRYPGCPMQSPILFFQRDDPKAMLEILRGAGDALVANTASLAVHVDGTRSLSCRQPVQTVSSVFIDLALRTGSPLVPVRFGGGLPVEPAAARLEFPYRMGAQVFTVGASIPAERLEELPLAERRDFVVDRINQVGGSAERDEPGAPDPVFAEKVESWRSRSGVSEPQAVLTAALQEWRSPHPAVAEVLARLEAGDGAEGLGAWERALMEYLTRDAD